MGKKNNGIAGTVIFHIGILVFVMIFGFATPLPLPDEQGILINFGTDETGAGDLEPMMSEITEASAPPPSEISTPSESTEEVMAQDFEEAPAVEEQEEIRQDPVEQQVVPEENAEQDTEETPPPPEEEPRELDQRAIYTGRKNTDDPSGSEGITEGDGNQGSITGSPDSDNYSPGISSGQRGIDFSLSGRNPVSLPKPEYNAQVSGTIVVRIRVNRDGKVISAEPGVRGSNILDETLLEAARKAALKARFNSKADAAITQTGTITYLFILQKLP